MSQGRPFEVILPLPVRTYDIDFAGIVGNIVYIRWLEDLRVLFLEEYLPLEEHMARGVVPVLLRTEIDYRKAIRLFDAPMGRMWVKNVERLRWTLRAEIVVGDRVVAEATQVCIFASKETFRPVRVPRTFLDQFIALQGELDER